MVVNESLLGSEGLNRLKDRGTCLVMEENKAL